MPVPTLEWRGVIRYYNHCARYSTRPDRGGDDRNFVRSYFGLEVVDAEGVLIKLGVVAGDGVGPEVTAEGLDVLAAVARIEGIRLRDRPLRPGGRTLPEDRRGPARRRDRAAARLRRHPARRRRPPRRPPRRSRKGNLAPPPLRLPPVHQPEARPALYGCRVPDQGQGARRHRHGRRPGEQRRPLRRRRGVHSQGNTRGSGDPDVDQYPRGRRAHDSIRLRAGAAAAPRSAHSAVSPPPIAARASSGRSRSWPRPTS